MSVTQKQIAARLGVSRELVAHALNRRPGVAAATRDRILAMAEELGYRPNQIARQLKGQRSQLIGVLIGHDNPQVNFDRLMQLELEAFRHGYRLIVGHLPPDADRTNEYLEDFADRGVDGVVWLDQPAAPRPLAEERITKRIQHLISLHDPLIKSAYRVHVDYADGIRQAVRHLRTRGRQRIGLVLAATGWEGNPLGERRRGYVEELAAQHLPQDDNLIWIGADLLASPAAHADAVVARLVGEQRADALLASNDFWAVDLIKALRRAGRRVPTDVAVVGFDNLNIATVIEPALTSIDQNHPAFARAVVGMLDELVAGGSRPPPRLVTIQPQLVVRETT